MPFKLPSQLCQRAFSTSARSRASPRFHTYAPPIPSLSVAPTVPKLGPIGRWYLPTMALIALSMTILPLSNRDSPLHVANRQIGFAITNALEGHNRASVREKEMELIQNETYRLMLEANGKTLSQSERNRLLLEAYGERGTLADVERALQLYEVQ